MMELQQWAHQLKSLATHSLHNLSQNLNQSSLQSDNVDLSTVLVLSYFLITLIKLSASRVYTLMAILFSIAIAHSQIYQALSSVQYHTLFAIIYLSVTYKVKPIKAKVACCLLGSFQIIMAWDSYFNAKIETFIWLHYEVIVCLLHTFIIGSFIEKDTQRIRRAMGSVVAFVRKLFGYSCNRLCLWYY